MAYGSVLADVVQGSTSGTPPQFNDGNGTQTGTLCRAWVDFNGQGTVTIRASFNVSSVTDNGTGDYIVNLTTALSDANGAPVTTSWRSSTSTPDYSRQTQSYMSSSSTVRIATYDSTTAKEDHAYINCAVFR